MLAGEGSVDLCGRPLRVSFSSGLVTRSERTTGERLPAGSETEPSLENRAGTMGASFPPVVPVHRMIEAREEERISRETRLMTLFRERRGSLEFQALYEFASASLLAWIAGQIRGRRLSLDPQELLQDTFVNIYRYAGGFRDERSASFRVWSRRIAMNVVRRASPRSGTGISWQSLAEGAHEPADRRSGPIEQACRGEEARSLDRAWMLLLSLHAAAFSTLRDRERRALDLIEIHGYSYAEAAAELGVGPSNMKMIVFRARKRIRREIARRLELAQASARRMAV
jgi:RNA polymerase sigma-70 factor, ECF subfamily